MSLSFCGDSSPPLARAREREREREREQGLRTVDDDPGDLVCDWVDQINNACDALLTITNFVEKIWEWLGIHIMGFTITAAFGHVG